MQLSRAPSTGAEKALGMPRLTTQIVQNLMSNQRATIPADTGQVDAAAAVPPAFDVALSWDMKGGPGNVVPLNRVKTPAQSRAGHHSIKVRALGRTHSSVLVPRRVASDRVTRSQKRRQGVTASGQKDQRYHRSTHGLKMPQMDRASTHKARDLWSR